MAEGGETDLARRYPPNLKILEIPRLNCRYGPLLEKDPCWFQVISIAAIRPGSVLDLDEFQKLIGGVAEALGLHLALPKPDLKIDPVPLLPREGRSFLMISGRGPQARCPVHLLPAY